MKRLLIASNIALWTVVTGLFCIVVALVRQSRPQTPELGGPKVGDSLADFNLPAIQGPDQSLENLSGDEYSIVFASATCSHCKSLVKSLAETALSNNDFPSRRVILNWVGEIPDDLTSTVRTLAHRMPVTQEKELETSFTKSLEFNGFPTFVSVSGSGAIIEVGIPMVGGKPFE